MSRSYTSSTPCASTGVLWECFTYVFLSLPISLLPHVAYVHVTSRILTRRILSTSSRQPNRTIKK
jgi:hypothetical protein